jgi:hypothetical protein
MGAGQRLQRPSTHASGRAPSGPLSPAAASAAAAAAAGGAAAALASKKTRRRWLEEENDSISGGDDFIPVGRQDQAANTGHIVRMRRGEAWSKFLAYEGCCQVGGCGIHTHVSAPAVCGTECLLVSAATGTTAVCRQTG